MNKLKFRIFTGEEMIVLPLAGTGYFDFEGSYALSFVIDGYDGFWAHENYAEQSKKAKKFPIMQFTGLKDKNNKEAYFDDLCHLCEGYGENGGIFKIEENEYGEPYFIAAASARPDIFRIGFKEYFTRHGENNFEIIGSIYENTELLKK